MPTTNYSQTHAQRLRAKGFAGEVSNIITGLQAQIANGTGGGTTIIQGGGGIGGGGVLNQIPKFGAGNSLANSALNDNGNAIAVSNNYPIYWVNNSGGSGGTGAGLTLDNTNTMYLAYDQGYALKIRDGMAQGPTSFQAMFISSSLNYGYTFENQGNIYVYQGTVIVSSDERLKENIRQIDQALDKVLRLTGVYFNWKNKAQGANRFVGFIAQDVRKILPEVVTEARDGMLSIDYARMVPLLAEALKEEHERVTELKKRLERLEASIATKEYNK